MKFSNVIISIAVTAALLLVPNFSYAASPTAYNNQSINGVSLKYVTVDMNNKNIKRSL